MPFELEDIQSGVLRPRPTPFAAAYLIFRIDDRADGRAMMRRLSEVVSPAANPGSPGRDAWISAAISYTGLVALGVPQASLDTFPVQFREGMAARAAGLGDVDDSGPERWEKPLGSPDVHVVVTAIAPDDAGLARELEQSRVALQSLPGVVAIWRQDCHILPGEREPFGFKDGISHPAIEGSGIAGTNPHEVPLKGGEFVLGYPDEMSDTPMIPQPDILGRNGSFVAFRKLYQRVAEFRRYIKSQATSAEDEEFIAAKMMGRWRSGAPLALCPTVDDPALGEDQMRNNAFLFRADDNIGYKTPLGSHIRRTNPRDADVAGVPRIHRMIRRGTAYGTALPDGVLDDDGVDRGIIFTFVGANIGRQFEFVQKEWVNASDFFSGPDEKDPVIGASVGGAFTIPRRPIRRQLKALPRFVVTRGGEYCFLPGLRALRWLGELDT